MYLFFRRNMNVSVISVPNCCCLYESNEFIIFSENYIFGKFDTFCKRLEKIAHMITTMQAYSAIGDVRIEGIEIIAVRYKTIIEAVRKKTYDILDHRKSDFDVDYAEFLTQFEGLQAQIQSFVDSWFEKNLTVHVSPTLILCFCCYLLLLH